MNAVIFLGLLKLFAKLTAGECASSKCLSGKTVVLTGGNSGIGYETALQLASRGCKLIIADVADSEKAVRDIILDTKNEKISHHHLDLSSLQSVRKFTNYINTNERRLDILINNAGSGGFPQLFTGDGILKVMQINHFGPFLLTYLLANLLKNTPNSRIVFLNSIAAFTHQLNLDAVINKPSKYKSPFFCSIFEYSNSMLCSLAVARCFAAKLAEHGVAVNSVYPGIVDTDIYKTSFANMDSNSSTVYLFSLLLPRVVSIFGKTPLEGSQTTLHCALSSDVYTTGRFYADCMKIIHPTLSQIEAFRWKVWDESETIVKIRPNEKL